MYPSDYGYASGNNCATNISLGKYNISCKAINWLYNSCSWQWLMSPGIDASGVPFNNFLSKKGNLPLGYYESGDSSSTMRKCSLVMGADRRLVRDYGYVFPTFYLTSTTTIVSGTGSIDDPYTVR